MDMRKITGHEELLWYVQHNDEIRKYSRRLSAIYWELYGGLYVFIGTRPKKIYMVMKDILEEYGLPHILSEIDKNHLNSIDINSNTTLGNLKRVIVKTKDYIDVNFESRMNYEDSSKADDLRFMLNDISSILEEIRENTEKLLLESFIKELQTPEI